MLYLLKIFFIISYFIFINLVNFIWIFDNAIEPKITIINTLTDERQNLGQNEIIYYYNAADPDIQFTEHGIYKYGVEVTFTNNSDEIFKEKLLAPLRAARRQYKRYTSRIR